jgi:type VI secretion system FHA domain protein
MPLKLRIISDQYKQLGKASSQLFGVSGGKIGRAPDNDWVLPDPDRYVSSHHAKISFRAGSWILEDISTNGVFVNDNDIPLSVSGPRKLKEGDRLRFGDYDIIVTIDENNDFSPDASGQMPAPSSVRDRAAKPTRSSANEIDYLRGGTFRNHSRSRTREHMGDDLGEDLDVTGLLVSGSRDNRANDAVAAFDRHAEESVAPARAPAPPPKAAKSSGPASLLDDLLHEDARSEMPDNVTDDWHMTTRRLQKRQPTVAAAAPLLQVVAAPTPAPQPKPLPVTIAKEKEPAPRPEPIAARAEPALRVEPERSRRGGDGYAELQAGVEALCRGAGIDPNSLPADAHTTLLTLAGQMLRETVLDLTEALRNRNDQKNRFHVANTAIRPNNNNPLKFSASVEEALRRMLDGHSMRYLGGVEALREAFTDLKNHQLAIDAGMHAALNDLLSRVDPTELQDRFDRGLKRNPLLGVVNKTKYWELYTEFYPLLNQRDTRGWPAVFTEEFTRAYAEKVDELENPKRR